MYNLLVKVPMTLPSSFLATESQSWEAISAATFFAVEQWEVSMFLSIIGKDVCAVQGVI